MNFLEIFDVKTQWIIGQKSQNSARYRGAFWGKNHFLWKGGSQRYRFFLQNSMSLLTNSISGNSVFFLSKTHKKKCGKVYKAQQGTNPPTYGVFEWKFHSFRILRFWGVFFLDCIVFFFRFFFLEKFIVDWLTHFQISCFFCQ